MQLKTLRLEVTATGDLLDPGAGKRIVLYDMTLSASAAAELEVWHGAAQTDNNTVAHVLLPANGTFNRPFRRRNAQVGHVLPVGEVLKLVQTGVANVKIVLDYDII